MNNSKKFTKRIMREHRQKVVSDVMREHHQKVVSAVMREHRQKVVSDMLLTLALDVLEIAAISFFVDLIFCDQ